MWIEVHDYEGTPMIFNLAMVESIEARTSEEQAVFKYPLSDGGYRAIVVKESYEEIRNRLIGKKHDTKTAQTLREREAFFRGK